MQRSYRFETPQPRHDFRSIISECCILLTPFPGLLHFWRRLSHLQFCSVDKKAKQNKSKIPPRRRFLHGGILFKTRAEPKTCSKPCLRQLKAAAGASTDVALPPQRLQRLQEGREDLRTGSRFSSNKRSEGQIQLLAALYQDTAHILVSVSRKERPGMAKTASA